MFFITSAIAIGLIGLALFAIALVFKLMFWVLILPFRLLFKLVFGLGGLLVGAVMAPLILLVIGVGVILALLAGLVALLLPLLPVLLLGLVGWGIYKGASRRPTPSPGTP